MIRSEEAITEIVDNYSTGGHALIDRLQKDCQTKIKAQYAALGRAERTIRQSHMETIEMLKNDYNAIKGSTQALENQWSVRRRELQVAGQAALAANVK